MNQLTEGAVTILMAIIGVAILAVLVSRNSNTTGVLQALGSFFGNSLAVATGPVTGAVSTPNLSYPGTGLSMPALNLQGGFPH
jgi:hypothetical protein